MAAIIFNKKLRKKKRVSINIRGTTERPRVSVYRSNKYIYAQVIDDEKRVTIAASSSVKGTKGTKRVDEAKQVGIKLAEQLKEKKVPQVVFDRGRFEYKGRIKALAEGLREGGIQV